MADEKPFKVNRSNLPTDDMRQLFNPARCFAKGGLTMKGNKPVLAGECQVVQFGRNSSGNNCMFVCQANLSESAQLHRPVLASFVFDHEGFVIDLYYGNSDKRPEWRNSIRFGTRASFGFQPPPPSSQVPQSHAMLSFRIQEINEELKKANMTEDEIDLLLRKKARIKEEYEEEAKARKAYDELIKTPRWGCTSVLKGPLNFTGCQRRDSRESSVSLVEGFPYVSCVMAHGEFDDKLDTSPENLPNIKPYFKHDPVTGESKYGASGVQYYDGYGFENVAGNQGFESFVVTNSRGMTSTMETRNGSCPYPKPIPDHLRVSNPETNTKFKRMLMKGNASLRSEMKALQWIARTPLVFPTAIDSTFADRAFDWVHALSLEFEVPSRLSLSDAAMVKMIKSTTKASVAAMHSPAMRETLLAKITELPIGPRTIFKSCECTPMRHNPNCPNILCPFRHARLEELDFVWPRVRFASCEPAARLALEDEMLQEAAAAAAKQQAAAAAAAAKQQAADAKREQKNSRARQATAASAVAASAVAASAEPSTSVRRRTSRASSADKPVARGVKRSTDSDEQKPTRRRARGGAKSKSKRRLRK